MPRYIFITLPLAILAAPMPISAQDIDAPSLEQDGTASLTQMATTLADPERQREMALMVRAMGEVLLDMPIAPMVETLVDAAGEKTSDIPPNATLRALAPDAAIIPEMAERSVPRAMKTASAAARQTEAMLPMLRAMAKRMKDNFLPSR